MNRRILDGIADRLTGDAQQALVELLWEVDRAHKILDDQGVPLVVHTREDGADLDTRIAELFRNKQA